MRPPLLFEALRVTCLHVVLEHVNDSSLTFFIILVQRSEESFRYRRVAMKRGVCVELALSLEENLDRESGMLAMCCHHRGVRNQVRLSLQSTGICS